MDKDLISREWLEDAFDNLCCHDCKICRNFRIEDSIYKCALIDHAPTAQYVIKVKTAVDAQMIANELNRQAAHGVIIPSEYEIERLDRPHGEWQEPFESNGKTYHKCTHCHISSELILFGNFCPNCGADMRGGEDR